jgi:hypothetical protein
LRRRHGSAYIILSGGTAQTGLVPGLRSYATLPGWAMRCQCCRPGKRRRAEPATCTGQVALSHFFLVDHAAAGAQIKWIHICLQEQNKWMI